jgi:hypothetical protein
MNVRINVTKTREASARGTIHVTTRVSVKVLFMFDKLVEQKIREAMRKGEFDQLEGAGRPVNLDAYFATPEELRAGYAVLKNAGVLPQEAALLGELNELKRKLEDSRDERERERLRQSVNELTLKYNLLVEHYRGKRS